MELVTHRAANRRQRRRRAAAAVFLVALAFQLAYLISYIRITRRALRECAEMAEESRHRRLAREYQRYLLDTA